MAGSFILFLSYDVKRRAENRVHILKRRKGKEKNALQASVLYGFAASYNSCVYYL